LENWHDAIDASLLNRRLGRKERETLAEHYQPPWGFSLMA